MVRTDVLLVRDRLVILSVFDIVKAYMHFLFYKLSLRTKFLVYVITLFLVKNRVSLFEKFGEG